jgi:hypothetical protein
LLVTPLEHSTPLQARLLQSLETLTLVASVSKMSVEKSEKFVKLDAILIKMYIIKPIKLIIFNFFYIIIFIYNGSI